MSARKSLNLHKAGVYSYPWMSAIPSFTLDIITLELVALYTIKTLYDCYIKYNHYRPTGSKLEDYLYDIDDYDGTYTNVKAAIKDVDYINSGAKILFNRMGPRRARFELEYMLNLGIATGRIEYSDIGRGHFLLKKLAESRRKPGGQQQNHVWKRPRKINKRITRERENIKKYWYSMERTVGYRFTREGLAGRSGGYSGVDIPEPPGGLSAYESLKLSEESSTYSEEPLANSGEPPTDPGEPPTDKEDTYYHGTDRDSYRGPHTAQTHDSEAHGFFSNTHGFEINGTNQFLDNGGTMEDVTVNMIGSYSVQTTNIHQETRSAAPWAFVAGASIGLQVQSILRPTERSVREKQNDSHTSSSSNVEVDASHLLSTCTLLIMGLRHKLPDAMCSKIRKQAAWPYEAVQITGEESGVLNVQVTYEKVTVSLSTGEGGISSLD